ncbi:MAG: PilZ domain-containing protein [Nitrospira sp.]
MRQFALRHHYRFPVFGPMQYKHGNRGGYGTVTNVSSIGWRVSGSLMLEPGDVCALIIKLPGKTWISVAAGKVRWVRGEEAGIETLVMNEESEARLNAYILERIKTL